jgi:cytochrome c biogenesis protein CcdA
LGSLLLQLLPFAIGLAATPGAIATGILFLGSKQALANAIAFAAAFSLVYAGLAAVVLLIAGAADEPLIDDRTKSIVTLAIGLLLLALALLGWLRGRGRPPQRPRWLDMVDTANPREALGLGVALAVLNPNIPILLGGLTTIAAADVSAADEFWGTVFLRAAPSSAWPDRSCGMWPGRRRPAAASTGSGTGWPGTRSWSTSVSWSSSAPCSPSVA